MPERKQKRARSKAARKVAEMVSSPGNAVSTAVENGYLFYHGEEQLLEARTLFVIKLYPLSHISQTLGIPREMLDRWARLFSWYEMRKRREEFIYSKIGGQISKIADTLGLRTDEVASNIEGCIEENIRLRQASGDPIPAKDISTLTKALKDLYELRRSIHGKEGKVDRKILEVQGNTDLVRSLTAALNHQSATHLPKLKVQDAEYEELGDAKAG